MKYLFFVLNKFNFSDILISEFFYDFENIILDKKLKAITEKLLV